MYEETKSIDWKGIILKVAIAFLVILIAIKGFSLLKGDKEKTDTPSNEVTVDKNATATFTSNLEKLRDAGKTYFESNGDKLPKGEGSQAMITLNELISLGNIASLSDEEGKSCDGESSYVTAILEGNDYKLKANLVCGDASSYSLVYLDSYDDNEPITDYNNNTVVTNNKTSNTKTSSSSSSCTSCGTKVNVQTNTSVSQNVTVNGKTQSSTSTSKPNNNSNNNNNNGYLDEVEYYTVSFDENGGNRFFRDQTVRENGKATNPGSPSKSGYTFLGWYLNGTKYNFNTKVTKDIVLVAKYQRNYYDDDDYYNDDDYYDDDDYEVTKTYTNYVYSMGYNNYGDTSISISHTLKLPSYLNKNSITNVRIKNIEFYSAIDTVSEMKNYANKHASTFIYNYDGWEYDGGYDVNTLSTVKKSNVWFDYQTNYKSLRSAINNGFNVSWDATKISQCSDPFNGTSCNVGVVYKVTWEYQELQ